MATTDGSVIGTTRIVDHGSPAERFNLVLVAEGYRTAELAQFATDAEAFVNRLFATPPFDALQDAFNVYRIDVASTDSGADDPAACGGTGATPATYFDASFCSSGIRRLLVANTNTVRTVANAEVPEWHQILVMVNSPTWGGSGGAIPVMSTSPGWEDGAIHEFGHASFGLADEYEYWGGCGIDVDRNNHPAAEPSEPNVTVDSNRATVKWGDLILPTTPVPTTSNANCALCDPQVNPVPPGTVGLFEGAHYYHCDVFRPQFDCMMRNLSPFCAVCRRRIEQTLSPYMEDCVVKYGLQTCTRKVTIDCVKEELQGSWQCDRFEDRGYWQCTSWSKTCKKWLPWPFSYLCDAFEWVCKASVWVANLVCVAWVWITYWACVAWRAFVTWICRPVSSVLVWWCRQSKQRD